VSTNTSDKNKNKNKDKDKDNDKDKKEVEKRNIAFLEKFVVLIYSLEMRKCSDVSSPRPRSSYLDHLCSFCTRHPKIALQVSLSLS